MRTLSGIALAILPLLCVGFAPGTSRALGSIRGDVFTKGANGALTVVPGALFTTTSPQLTQLKAMDCAFSRRVHHA